MRRTRTPRALTLSALVAAAAACGAVAALAVERQILHSTVAEWSALKFDTTKIGARSQVFRAPTARLDELEMHITTLNPGEAPHAPHRHVDEEMIILKDGSVDSTLNGETRRVTPGGVIFQASDELHGIRNPGPGPATYYVIKWTVHGSPTSQAAIR